jgi:uncharacterized iron-regulated membrane protein
MDWHISILLVAIVFTFLAWRRARRESEVARARTAAMEEPRWTYRLEPLDTEMEAGYRVVAGDGSWADDRAPDWDVHGIDIIAMGPDHVRAEAIRHDAFQAGGGIALATDPRVGGEVVTVWDEARSVQLGWVPARIAPSIAARLAAGELTDCVILREHLRDGERTGVELLLVHRDAAVET